MRATSRWVTLATAVSTLITFMADNGVAARAALPLTTNIAGDDKPAPGQPTRAANEEKVGPAGAVECAKDDILEGEFEGGFGCGIPIDSHNGGCNSVPEVYGSIQCGQTICGSAGGSSSYRDTDWYTITIAETTAFTWSMLESGFDWFIVVDQIGGCEDISFPRHYDIGLAGEPGSVVTTENPGTYVMFVAPSFFGPLDCPTGYRVELTCAGSGADCNENGIDDAQDIASGTSRDCFDSGALQAPGEPYVAGGPNAIPDECECVADWDRNGTANSADVGAHINTYFLDQSTGLTTFADVDCNGVSNSADVGEFINLYFAAQAGQLPFAGCEI